MKPVMKVLHAVLQERRFDTLYLCLIFFVLRISLFPSVSLMSHASQPELGERMKESAEKQGSAETGQHVKEGTQTYAEKAKGTGQQVGQQTKETTQSAAEKAKGTGQQVGQKAQETAHTATEKTRAAGQQASEKVGEGAKYAKESAESAAEGTRAAAQQTGQTVSASAASAKESVQTTAQQAGQTVDTGVSGAMKSVGMNIRFSCPSCGQPSSCPPNMNVICPHCRTIFTAASTGERVSEMAKELKESILEALPSQVTGRGG